jgi:hypothetical protein
MRERQAVHYPRNEWFYLEDNRLEAEEEKANSEYVELVSYSENQMNCPSQIFMI